MIQSVTKFFDADIGIWKQTTGHDSYGQPTNVFALDRTIKGRVRQLNGSEQLRAGKETEVSTHRLYCNDFDILATDIIKHDGKTYDVITANNVMNFDGLAQIDMELRQ